MTCPPVIGLWSSRLNTAFQMPKRRVKPNDWSLTFSEKNESADILVFYLNSVLFLSGSCLTLSYISRMLLWILFKNEKSCVWIIKSKHLMYPEQWAGHWGHWDYRTLSLPSKAHWREELIRKSQSQPLAVCTGAAGTRKLNRQPGKREPPKALVTGQGKEK